jgi:hypothetical protein
MDKTETKFIGKNNMSITREGGREGDGEIIVPMKAAYSKESRLDKLEPAGTVGTTELWLQKAAGEGAIQ